jgi:hypothetical protein
MSRTSGRTTATSAVRPAGRTASPRTEETTVDHHHAPAAPAPRPLAELLATDEQPMTEPTIEPATPAPSRTFTAYAWYRLVTDPSARGLSAIRKLAYVAVAHHADHTDGYRTSAATDLVGLTLLPLSALVPALAALQAAGWLDGDTHGYRPTAAAFAFVRGETADDTSIAGAPQGDDAARGAEPGPGDDSVPPAPCGQEG